MVEQPLWRSLLYVPANNAKFIAKAHQRQADGIILDLEDSVPVTERDGARDTLGSAIASSGQNGADVLVRVNAAWEVWQQDIDAAVVAGVRALVLPKVDSPANVQERSEAIGRLEQQRGLPAGSIGLYVLVESPGAIFRVDEIARCDDRILGVGLGAEDFAQAVGMESAQDTLALPRQLTLYAARAAGVIPIGLMGSIVDYTETQLMRQVAMNSVRFGFEGATCIHPMVVPILNEAFTPSQIEVDEARRLVQLYDEAADRGVGAISLDGRMIDVPVAERSRRLLLRHQAILDRQSRLS